MKYIFGSVPSRRLGNSLGVSPIPERTCNFSCTYCQLGRTKHMSNERKDFFPVQDILDEFKGYQEKHNNFDVVSVVGEGEPTLYAGLGELIVGLKKLTDKPIAVITNGAQLVNEDVRKELMNADFVLPSMDGFDRASFKAIDRPIGSIDFQEVIKGITQFSKEYKGQLWLEIMFIDGINTTEEAMAGFKEQLAQIDYDRLYLNTPVRPPAEKEIQPIPHEVVEKLANELGGISIDALSSGSFCSEIEDNLLAIINICMRHPMNNFEVVSFLKSRELSEDEIAKVMDDLNKDERVTQIEYKGIITYRVIKG